MEITPITNINKKKGLSHYLAVFLYKTGGATELLIVVLVWFFIFKDGLISVELTKGEMITYLVTGNIIGFITGYLLERMVVLGIAGDDSGLLIHRPLKFFSKIFVNGFGRNFVPFIMVIIFNLGILYYFKESLVVNYEKMHLLVIFLMVLLAFVTEVLFAYLLRFFVFWFFETSDRYNILIRFKKMISGNYFPLNFLPAVFVNISMIMPFSYAFYVPTQLYLKKISLYDGYFGLVIQLGWVFLLYGLIRFVWIRKLNKQQALDKQEEEI